MLKKGFYSLFYRFNALHVMSDINLERNFFQIKLYRVVDLSWKLSNILETQSCIVDSFLSGNTALGQATLQEANKQEQAAREAGRGIIISGGHTNSQTKGWWQALEVTPSCMVLFFQTKTMKNDMNKFGKIGIICMEIIGTQTLSPLLLKCKNTIHIRRKHT